MSVRRLAPRGDPPRCAQTRKGRDSARGRNGDFYVFGAAGNHRRWEVGDVYTFGDVVVRGWDDLCVVYVSRKMLDQSRYHGGV